ncbi:MAG TPA: DedA family protein [Pyrinomonadaceae bacterium]
MSYNDYLLSTLGLYGLPVLFGILVVGCMGVPMPSSLLLLVAGSLTEQGDMSLWPTLGLAAAGAIIGDNIGYSIGRWGGGRVRGRLARIVGGEEKLKKGENWLRRWEGAGVFFSRWLLTPLGPIVNLTSGLTNYSWPRFFFYDVIGEVLWVTLYVMLGRFFSDRVQEMSELLGDFVWMIIGLIFAVALGLSLLKYFRAPSKAGSKKEASNTLTSETP